MIVNNVCQKKPTIQPICNLFLTLLHKAMQENSDKNLLKDFQTFLKIYRSASEKTISSYSRDLQHFFEVLNITTAQQNDPDFLVKIGNDEIKKWLFERKSKTTNRTISRQIVAIKMFFMFLSEVYDAKNGKILNMSGLKFINGLPKAVESDLIIEIIDNIESVIKYKNSFEIARDKLLFTLLFATGMRISEALAITHNQLKNEQIVVFGKGQKERLVPMLDIIKTKYKQYLQSAKECNITLQDAVFIGSNGKKLTARAVQHIFEKIKICYGLQHFSPHTMRHSFATALLENGANINQIQVLLGHENLSTTQKYTKITKKSLADKLNKVGW